MDGGCKWQVVEKRPPRGGGGGGGGILEFSRLQSRGNNDGYISSAAAAVQPDFSRYDDDDDYDEDEDEDEDEDDDTTICEGP
ncbi:hypothetical protein M0804_014961 [Polistes exclamans]|nr:hypothetical protein M0804_014962 [Polistes exclamans]KAI4474210.1 hypothetical protein M0804_014961 [Polistes exclamans]